MQTTSSFDNSPAERQSEAFGGLLCSDSGLSLANIEVQVSGIKRSSAGTQRRRGNDRFSPHCRRSFDRRSLAAAPAG